MNIKKYVAFTEEEVKTLVEMWPNHSTSDIAKAIERTPSSVTQLAGYVRKAGYNLPKKSGARHTLDIIKRALNLK